MAEGFSILVDTSRCTACRGCQVACKQWNGLPGTSTRNRGGHENPPDLSFQTFKVLRFAEGRDHHGNPYWYFFAEQCRHCLVPGCMASVEKEEIVQDEVTGAVLYSASTKELDFKAVLEGCPYNIPRQAPETKALHKCNMCYERITSGMVPACVKTCPTGAMQFGERDAVLALCEKRLADLRRIFPKAAAINPDDVRVIYIVTDDPKTYWKHAAGR